MKQPISHVQLVQATLTEYSIIQKMWPFYIYDLGRECDAIEDWTWPTDPSFVPDDLTPFFHDSDKQSLLIKIGNEWGGFIDILFILSIL